jgi:mono/diheme cytochrome c family protein
MRSICLIAVLALLVAVPLSLWSQENADGAQIFKTKCANCHGANGEGKPAVKMPAVKGTEMSVDALVTYLTKGESGKKIHSKPVSGVTEEQAKIVAEFTKTLK